MRDWLKTTLARLVILSLVIAAAAWLFIFWPASRAKHLINEQISAAAQASSSLQAAIKTLASLPAIGQISAQQPGPFADYAGAVNQKAGILNRINISYDKPRTIVGLRISRKTQVISETNKTISNISEADVRKTKSDIKDAQNFLSYHAAVSKALANTLEYDPAADTANFSLGSNDTDQRLKLAQNGLAKTLGSLNGYSGKYNDPALAQILTKIQDLQNSRDRLAKDGDTAAWTTVVGQDQSDIIANRKIFLSSNISKFKFALNTDSDKMIKIQRVWIDLSSKY